MLAPLAALFLLAAPHAVCGACHWMPLAVAPQPVLLLSGLVQTALFEPAKPAIERVQFIKSAKADPPKPPDVPKDAAKVAPREAVKDAVKVAPRETVKDAVKVAPKEAAKVVPPPTPTVISAPRALAEPPARGADLTRCASCHASLTADRKPHSPLKDGTCSACHVANPGAVGKCKSPAGSAWKLVAEQPALCAKCHDTSGAAPPHPVIKAQGCTSCHDPHGGDFRFNLADAEGTDLCLKCHAALGAKLKAKVPHKALIRYGCVACHDPHASNNAKGLVKATNELCSSCHQGQADGAHTGVGHKVEGGPDPRRPGQPFSCISCHDPHGSDNPRFFRSGSTAQESCKGCHTNTETFR